MKKDIKNLKLGQLSRNLLEEKTMNIIHGCGSSGNHCEFGNENLKANEAGGVCSCSCASDGMQYYDASGLHSLAEFYRDTSSSSAY